jgi:zinc/manganese transport system substrate-binding protein
MNTMLKIISGFLILFSINLTGYGKMKVVTSYRYIADIVRHIGGDDVSVTALAEGDRDPHFITPKPSFIAKLRKADLLIINGGQLEIGWIPPVIRQANNPHINPGARGFLSLMPLVKPIDVHLDVSRAHGDVHPQGNPHIQLDPRHIPLFAQAITERCCQLDPGECGDYRKNFDTFVKQWQEKTAQWDKALQQVKGLKVVQYHKLYDYLFERYQVESADTLEPLPGIPPSAGHISQVIDLIGKQQIRIIVQDVYHSSRTARFVAEKTGARVVVIPHDVGAVKEATDIFSLFDEIVRRLTRS